MAGVVHADEPSKADYDLTSEIAWARESWPDDFKGMHFHSPLAQLLYWAPHKGSVPAYLFTDDFACRRVELSRDEPERGAAVDTPPELSGKINGRPYLRDGHQVRELTIVSIGQELFREDGATHVEGLDARGRWQPEESGGIGVPPIVYGALSYADDRVARFDGEPQVLHAYCSGPTEWLSCPTGGERPCERCQQVSLLFAEKNSCGVTVGTMADAPSPATIDARGIPRARTRDGLKSSPATSVCGAHARLRSPRSPASTNHATTAGASTVSTERGQPAASARASG